MSKSKIEWTEVTWNPVLGCSKVSEGCRNCYAMTMSSRIANAAKEKESPSAVERGYMKVVPKDETGKYLPKWNNKIALIEERLEDPLRWQKPRMVFVNSMSDLFHPDVPFEFVHKVFVVMSNTPQHTYQVLTKRPERLSEYCKWEKEKSKSEIDYVALPLPNCWLGTSVENQETADERIPHLLQCPASVRFLSCEPLLGPVNLNGLYVPPEYASTDDSTGIHYSCLEEGVCIEEKIHWVIVGGESGPNARPMHQDWIRLIRDQCIEAGVAFFFKQWGKFVPGHIEQFPFWVDDEYKIKNEERSKLKEVPVYFKGEDLPWKYFEAPVKVKWRKIDGREWNQTPADNL